jgi:glyoxylase-like metal-dependent hydrolase (beta-lactamase superfamily II)
MSIHTLDLHFQEHKQAIAAYLIESRGELALVETGPGSTLTNLLMKICELGFNPHDVKKVLVTHIHLDHAGAAGWWAQQGATVYVHPRGAAHLIDPTKLMNSARMVYGDQMESLWGEMLPAPADKVVTLEDGECVTVGDVALTAMDTPGHARHHLAFACGEVCFTGDVAGMRLPGSDYLSVTAAPPQFDPVAYLDSLSRLQDAGFQKLYLTHFGVVTEVSQHLAKYASRVSEVYNTVEKLMGQGLSGRDLQMAYGALERQVAESCGLGEADWLHYEAVNSSALGTDGIARYCSKQPHAH